MKRTRRPGKVGPKGQRKVSRVMSEFYEGELRSSSGRKVTDPQQAKAIAMSEGRRAEGISDNPGVLINDDDERSLATSAPASRPSRPSLPASKTKAATAAPFTVAPTTSSSSETFDADHVASLFLSKLSRGTSLREALAYAATRARTLSEVKALNLSLKALAKSQARPEWRELLTLAGQWFHFQANALSDQAMGEFEAARVNLADRSSAESSIERMLTRIRRGSQTMGAPAIPPLDAGSAILRAYNDLRAETGLRNVLIADLIDRAALPIAQVHQYLLREIAAHRANPTLGDPTAATQRELNAALLLEERPHIYIDLSAMAPASGPSIVGPIKPSAVKPKVGLPKKHKLDAQTIAELRRIVDSASSSLYTPLFLVDRMNDKIRAQKIGIEARKGHAIQNVFLDPRKVIGTSLAAQSGQAEVPVLILAPVATGRGRKPADKIASQSAWFAWEPDRESGTAPGYLVVSVLADKPPDLAARMTDLRVATRKRYAPAAAPASIAAPTRPPPETVSTLPTTPARFKADVLRAAKSGNVQRWGKNKVYLASLWGELRKQAPYSKYALGDFKLWLPRARQQGLLKFARADLVELMPRELVQASEVQDIAGAYHFLEVPEREDPKEIAKNFFADLKAGHLNQAFRYAEDSIRTPNQAKLVMDALAVLTVDEPTPWRGNFSRLANKWLAVHYGTLNAEQTGLAKAVVTGNAERSLVARDLKTEYERLLVAMTPTPDLLPGGLADKGPPSHVDPKQIQKGIETEQEHTDDPAIAREIALDHLTEDPRYYDKLEAMEEGLAATPAPKTPARELKHGDADRVMKAVIEISAGKRDKFVPIGLVRKRARMTTEPNRFSAAAFQLIAEEKLITRPSHLKGRTVRRSEFLIDAGGSVFEGLAIGPGYHALVEPQLAPSARQPGPGRAGGVVVPRTRAITWDSLWRAYNDALLGADAKAIVTAGTRMLNWERANDLPPVATIVARLREARCRLTDIGDAEAETRALESELAKLPLRSRRGPPRKATTNIEPRLLDAYENLVNATGSREVCIAALGQKSGVSLPDLKQWLWRQIDAGHARLARGDPANASPEQLAAGLDMAGKVYLKVDLTNVWPERQFV
jgi:hypothetical protein